MSRLMIIAAVLVILALLAPAADASELSQRHGHPGVSVGGNWHHGGGVGFRHPFGFHPIGFGVPAPFFAPIPAPIVVPVAAPVVVPVPVQVPVSVPVAVPVPALPSYAPAAPCGCPQ